MYFRLPIAVLMVATTALEVGAAAEMCSSISPFLSVESSRNTTGHWLVNVRLDQEIKLPGRTSLLLMTVRPTISHCKSVQIDSIGVTLQGPPLPSLPNPDYEELPGVGYYKFHESRKWEDAKKICESEDAHLLIINSETEASAIKQLIQRHTKGDVWIFVGFHVKNGQYVTIFGKPLGTTGFTRWRIQKPENVASNENCGVIHSLTVGLHYYGCNLPAQFICEHIAV